MSNKKATKKHPSKGLFWLASYPKSGNTWLRAYLVALNNDKENDSSGSDELEIDINKLNTGQIASNRYYLESIFGFSASDLSSDEVDMLRYDAYCWYSNQFVEKVAYHKVHDAFTFLSKGKPLLPSEEVLGTVYIVRNPLDVCISLANHMNFSITKSIESINDPDFALSGNNRTLTHQVRHWLLSWSDHYRSWARISDSNYHLVRYEDMKQNTLETFQSISKFLHLASDKKSVEAALEQVSFERLQKQELEKGFKERPEETKSFFRKGIIGDWQTELEQSQIDSIIDYHYDVMLELGYIDESGKPTELITST